MNKTDWEKKLSQFYRLSFELRKPIKYQEKYGQPAKLTITKGSLSTNLKE
jgi:hypothetical protein